MKRDIKRDIKTGTWLLYGLMAVAVTGCVREGLETGTRDTVRLTVVGRALETRAVAGSDGSTSFTDGDALSLFMRGTTYANVDNRKVDYSVTGSVGTWKIEGKEILLNDRTAVTSLVFPYSEAAAYDNIALAPGPYNVNKNDVVWKQQPVYASVHEAKVADMKHALARVKILLKRDDAADTAIPDRYTGTGSVTSVSLDNGAAVSGTPVVFTTGKLDLSFVLPASPVTGVTAGAVEDKTAFTLSTTGHTTDLLTLPVTAMAKDLVTLNIVVDGKTMTQSFPSASPADKWEAGTCYVYMVTVKNAGVTFDKVVTTQWETGNAIEEDLDIRTVVGAYKDGGIVFWVDPDDVTHYKVVSLDETNDNWNKSMAYTACYGWQWYMPTQDDLIELYNARNSGGGIGTSYIDRGIAGNGGVALGTGGYWSFTENGLNAQAVTLTNGTSAEKSKSAKFAVRAIKEVPTAIRAANCYVTRPGIPLMFDATKKPRTFDGSAGANLSTATADAKLGNDLLLSDIDKVEVVWQTAADHGTTGGETNMIIQKINYDKTTGICTVTPHATGCGNALIAAYKGTTILWNWHIWVTEGKVQANVNTGDMSLNGGGKFMDRNLGALAATTSQPTVEEAYKYFGVLYQHGRPTPFTGQGIGTTVNTYTKIYNGAGIEITGGVGGFTPNATTVSSVIEAIKTPDIFYSKQFNHYTWYSFDDIPLWSDAPDAKSIYDPCPYGYRIPVDGTWKSWTNQLEISLAINAGYSFNSSWWPIAGSRYYSGGAINVVGDNAYYWASTRKSNKYGSCYLGFNHSGVIYPSNDSGRSYCFSVRCVEDK